MSTNLEMLANQAPSSGIRIDSTWCNYIGLFDLFNHHILYIYML